MTNSLDIETQITACIKGLQGIARDHNEAIDLLTQRLIKLEKLMDRMAEFVPDCGVHEFIVKGKE